MWFHAPQARPEADVPGTSDRLSHAELAAERAAFRLPVVLVERGEKIRVVTAYGLDAGRKEDYLARRLRGE